MLHWIATALKRLAMTHPEALRPDDRCAVQPRAASFAKPGFGRACRRLLASKLRIDNVAAAQKRACP